MHIPDCKTQLHIDLPLLYSVSLGTAADTDPVATTNSPDQSVYVKL